MVELIDIYGSKTVGNMLVAFGYAREPRDPDADKQEPQQPEPAAETESGVEH